MKQRACIAIAICLRPKVIIADEPTSALDVVVQRQVMETLGRVQAELGAAVILIGHDMGLMAQFVDRWGSCMRADWSRWRRSRDIITAPRHPYTRLLIDSLPSLERKEALRGIPGLAPLLRELPPGCAFHPRCPIAEARCHTEKPAVRGIRRGCQRRMPPRMTPLLELRDVSKTLRRRHVRAGSKVALERFSFAIDAARRASPRWSARAAAARPPWRACCWA